MTSFQNPDVITIVIIIICVDSSADRSQWGGAG